RRNRPDRAHKRPEHSNRSSRGHSRSSRHNTAPPPRRRRSARLRPAQRRARPSPNRRHATRHHATRHHANRRPSLPNGPRPRSTRGRSPRSAQWPKVPSELSRELSCFFSWKQLLSGSCYKCRLYDEPAATALVPVGKLTPQPFGRARGGLVVQVRTTVCCLILPPLGSRVVEQKPRRPSG